VNAAVGATDHQRRLDPRRVAHLGRQIRGPDHRKEGDQGWLAVAKNDGAAAKDGKAGHGGRLLDAFALLFGKHARQHAAGGEVCASDAGIVANIAAQFEPAGDLLPMIAFDARSSVEKRWPRRS
jgi:hypothetical protein